MVVKYCKKIANAFRDGLLGLFGGTKKAYVLVKPFVRIREARRKRYSVGYVPRDAYLHYAMPTKDAGPERSGKKESLGGSSRGKSYIYGGIGLLVILVAIGAAWMLNRKGSTKPPQGENHPAPKQLNFEIAPNKAPFFVGRKKEMDALAPDLKKKTDKLVVLPPITGVSGSGKTELVLQLIAQYADQYDHIVWIDAFTKEDIEASYRQVAKDMGLSNGAASSVHHKLKGKRVLYVFDNAPDLKTIQPYLNLKEGHVLITSCNSNTAEWKKDSYNMPDLLTLRAFDEKEALDFAVKMGQDRNNKDLKKLTDLLPKYPLVLKLLFSYISAHQDTPQAFLKKVTKNSELINQLNNNPENQDETYEEVLSYIINGTLDALEGSTNGEAHLKLLKEITYLARKPVPLNFVLSKLDNAKKETQLRNILSILEKNGLISQGEHNIHMQSFIQDIISKRYLPALEQRKKLLDLYASYTVDKPHAFIANAYYGIGNFYYDRYDGYNATYYSDAIEAYEKAIAIYKAVYGNASDSFMAQAYYNIGLIYNSQKQYPKASEAYQNALKMYKAVSVYGDEPHARKARAYYNLGHTLHQQKKYDDAIDAYNQALDMYKNVHGENAKHVDIADVYDSLGFIYYTQKKYSEAIEAYDNALNRCLSDEVDGENRPHRRIVRAYRNLWAAYKADGKEPKKVTKYATLVANAEEKKLN